MEANHFSAMDEFRRVLLPMELCKNLGWKKGSKVSARINQLDKSLNIRATDDGASGDNAPGDGKMTIDELGRITLDESMLSELGWDIGKLSISIDSTGPFLVLKQSTNM